MRRAATTTAFGARFATVTPGKLDHVGSTLSDLYTARRAGSAMEACLGSLVVRTADALAVRACVRGIEAAHRDRDMHPGL